MNDISHFTELSKCIREFPEEWAWNLKAFTQKIRDRRGTLFVAGNGGSQAVAQHWAVDLQLARLRTYCLGTNVSRLTALSNDVAYSAAFKVELADLFNPITDGLICLSCSGTSPNIHQLLEFARFQSLDHILISSLNLANENYPAHTTAYRVNTYDYGVAEDVFAAIGHYLTRELFNDQ